MSDQVPDLDEPAGANVGLSFGSGSGPKISAGGSVSGPGGTRIGGKVSAGGDGGVSGGVGVGTGSGNPAPGGGQQARGGPFGAGGAPGSVEGGGGWGGAAGRGGSPPRRPPSGGARGGGGGSNPPPLATGGQGGGGARGGGGGGGGARGGQGDGDTSWWPGYGGGEGFNMTYASAQDCRYGKVWDDNAYNCSLLTGAERNQYVSDEVPPPDWHGWSEVAAQRSDYYGRKGPGGPGGTGPQGGGGMPTRGGGGPPAPTGTGGSVSNWIGKIVRVLSGEPKLFFEIAKRLGYGNLSREPKEAKVAECLLAELPKPYAKAVWEFNAGFEAPIALSPEGERVFLALEIAQSPVDVGCFYDFHCDA